MGLFFDWRVRRGLLPEEAVPVANGVWVKGVVYSGQTPSHCLLTTDPRDTALPKPRGNVMVVPVTVVPPDLLRTLVARDPRVAELAARRPVM